MILAEEPETSGNETLDGAPGTVMKGNLGKTNSYYIQIILPSSNVLTLTAGLLGSPSPSLV